VIDNVLNLNKNEDILSLKGDDNMSGNDEMTTVNIRISKTDKDEFSRFCQNVGLTMSSAVNLFVKKTLSERSIPFQITDDPFYSEENMAFLRESIAELKVGHTIEHDILED